MNSILDPKPELIRIGDNKSDPCFFCVEISSDEIIGENDKKIPLCRSHFRALCVKLKNFK